MILESARPSNYGMLTGLLTHMLRSVVSTPIEVPAFVNESLALLNARQLVDRFGMLFLHNLNLRRDNPLEDIQSEDDFGVLQAIGITDNLKKGKARLPTPQPEDNDIYPLGLNPTWKEIITCFRETPWLLMRSWAWRAEWSQLNNHAIKLFLLCTNHLWMSLNSQWLFTGSAPLSTTLEEAMKSWTVGEVHNTIRSLRFLPCNAGLEGSITGKRVKTFSERRVIFFPDDMSAEHPTSVWQPLARQPGYIHEYHEVVNSLDVAEKDNLNLALETLLAHTQCLPNGFRGSKKSKVRGAIWTWDRDGTVEVLANPMFYKLVQVGNGGEKKSKRPRKAPLHRSIKELEISLVEHCGYDHRVARQAVNWKRKNSRRKNANRSNQAKGKRVPPRRKKNVISIEDEAEDMVGWTADLDMDIIYSEDEHGSGGDSDSGSTDDGEREGCIADEFDVEDLYL